MEIEGQEVLSLQDTLHCSTHLNIKWHHCKISALHATNFGCTYKNQIFSWFMSDKFLKIPISSYWDSYVHSLWGGLRAKVVPERTTYRVTWGVPRRVPSSVSSSRLHSDAPSWAKCLRNSEDQDDRKKGTLSNQPRLTRITPTVLLGSWVLQPIKDMTSPWDWLQNACQIARVRWGTRCKGFNFKEGPHYCIEQSARNPLECKQVQRALGESSRSCRQTNNNQPLFRSLEIPWGFLAQAVLHWVSGGLCHARKCQFKGIM
jgi:hypothetical protein